MTTFNTAIAANADDGLEILAVSTWYTDDGFGSPNVFGHDTTGGGIGVASRLHAGVRFISITVPNAATINSAKITLNQFRFGGTATPSGVWRAVASDNAGQFSGGSRPSTASGTTASTAWVTNASGTPALVEHDVTSIVQEIVNRAGWSSGNAINFYCLADTEASTSLDAWDDFSTTSSIPAELDIDYTSGGSTNSAMFMVM